MFRKRPPEEEKKTTTTGNTSSRMAAQPMSPTPLTPAPKITAKGPAIFTSPATQPPEPSGPSHHSALLKNAPQSRTLVVGSGISVKGAIVDAECLIVEGIVEAEHLNAKELIVTANATFRGTIDVENVDLSGTIDGNLSARDSLTVRSTGRLLGKAECRRLQVEDGGQITGELNVITTPVAASNITDLQKDAAK